MAWYDGLSAEQKKVVGCDSKKSIRLLAGPGTGKTKCLIHRVAYLDEKKSAKNQDIVVITFTRAAANEIRERLIKELKHPYLHWQSTPESYPRSDPEHRLYVNAGSENFYVPFEQC